MYNSTVRGFGCGGSTPSDYCRQRFFQMDQDTNGALAALRHYGWADAPKKFIAKLLTLPAFWILVALLVFGLGLTVALLGYRLNLV